MARAEAYEAASVTGPTEFGELPEQDRIYWATVQQERAERQQEKQDEYE